MLAERIRAAREFLRGRRGAYRRLFLAESLDSAAVLRDLAKFCRANESTAALDPTIRAQMDGRREVWLRIQSHLRLSDEDLWRLYEPRLSKHEENA